MTNNKTDTDPDFCFPSSSLVPTTYHHQKARKRRTKLIKLEPTNNLTASGSTTIGVISKPKYYAKKPDPSAPKITKPCSECGKKFWSLKALFGHMRCHPERQWRGINPPPNFRKPISPSLQQPIPTPLDSINMTAEDREVASCLLLLASSTDAAAVLESDCGGGGGGGGGGGASSFECSSCKKVFGSHQALGGHRASHKNVKGCFAITRSVSDDGYDDHQVFDHDHSGNVYHVKENDNMEDISNNKMLIGFGHQCSICMKMFSSGQALGGHKRCHWEKAEEASISSSIMDQGLVLQGFSAKDGCGLDLNLPAPVEDESSSSYSSGLSLTLDLTLGL